MGLEQAAHALFVPDIGNDGLQAPGFDVLLKGQGGLGQGGLGYIGSYQKVGLEAQALADDLFAYGTGTAGDEYGLTFDGSLNGVQAQGDGRTVEEVLEFDVPQLVDLQVILYPGFRDGHFLDLHLVLQHWSINRMRRSSARLGPMAMMAVLMWYFLMMASKLLSGL